MWIQDTNKYPAIESILCLDLEMPDFINEIPFLWFWDKNVKILVISGLNQCSKSDLLISDTIDY